VTDTRGEERSGTAQRPRDPVFMLAPPRSYSTVSLAMLAGHPQLYGFPEMLLFTAPTVGAILAGTGRRPANEDWVTFGVKYGNAGIARAVAEVHEDGQSSEAVERAMDWLRAHSDWEPVDLMNYLLRLVHPKIGLEKSPGTVNSDKSINTCLQAYPTSKYLHLTRHPVSTVRSMQNHWAPLFRQETPPRMRANMCLMNWYTGHLRIVNALHNLPGDQWMRVRAEDLLRAPQVWLPRLLDWLSLDHDNLTIQLMMQTDQWRFARYRKGATGGGDISFFRDPALRPVGAPSAELISASWDITDEARRRVTALAKYLGY
jgi:Sulfotransferase family